MLIWLGGIGAAVLLLLAAVLVSNVHIHVSFSKHKSDDFARFNVRLLYGLIRLNYEIPSIVFKNMKEGFLVKTEQRANTTRNENKGSERVNKRKIEKWSDDVSVMLRSTAELKQWIRQTLDRVHMIRFIWTTRVSLGDAAHTAMLTGWLWGVKSGIVGFLSYQIRFDQPPQLDIVPEWSDEMEFRTDLDCRMKIKIWSIVVAGIRLLTRVLVVRGGWRMWMRLLKQRRHGQRRVNRQRGDSQV